VAFRVAAFGALNQDSYDVFAAFLSRFAGEAGIDVALSTAIPYPNQEAVSQLGRPLRAEALTDDGRKQELFAAVAMDARGAGADSGDIAVMPCMSMVGFHAGVEEALGRDILRLSDALAGHYKDVGRVGVLHMRPAKKSGAHGRRRRDQPPMMPTSGSGRSGSVYTVRNTLPRFSSLDVGVTSVARRRAKARGAE
jgi:hypothetical protein